MAILVNSKQYQAALAAVDQLQKQHPEEANDAKWNKYRANELIQAGRLDDAAQLALRSSGPDAATPLYTIGVAPWKKGYNNNSIDSATKQHTVELGLTALRKAIASKTEHCGS